MLTSKHVLFHARRMDDLEALDMTDWLFQEQRGRLMFFVINSRRKEAVRSDMEGSI